MGEWKDYVEATPSNNAETIKARLPIEWVITVEAQIPMEPRGDKLVGLCPFHDDVLNPSLDIYEDGQRWGCRVDGKGGDVLDFIKEMWHVESFRDQILRAETYLANMESYDDWSPTERTSTEEFEADLPALAIESDQATLRIAQDNTPLAELLDDKNMEIDAQWLTDKWLLGIDASGRVLAPYFNLEQQFVSHKVRMPEGWMAAKGAELSVMYGTDQLADADIDQPVWIFEGETDTWLGSWLLGDRGIALGLPTGAGAHPRAEWMDLLKGRRVTIMFDNDTAGRDAALRWHNMLKPYASSVLIAWPEGLDFCNSTNQAKALHAGVTVAPPADKVMKYMGGYSLIDKEGGPGKELSNWTVTPRMRIHVIDMNDEVISKGMEVVFDDRPGEPVRVNDDVWQNSAKMLKFINLHGKTWYGAGTIQSQYILSELQALTPFLGKERGVQLIGIHDPNGRPVFVLPDEVIGSEQAIKGWTYAPPEEGKANFSQYRLINDMDNAAIRTWGDPVVRWMMNLSSRGVITPIIAWMCAAIGRSLFDEFPPLGVFGGSGTGKTTLVRELMRTLWGLNEEHNLSSTTPFGIRSMVAGTNALPLWFDEYRHGARKDALDMMNQTLRDAWTASASSRGGVGDNMQRLHTTTVAAPIVVSGEESLEERSHIDRVVAISLSEDDKNREALVELQRARGEGAGRLGYHYISWFMWKMATDQLYLPEPKQSRQDQADSVLEWGWFMWREFCWEAFGVKVELEALDLSRVQQSRETTDESPIMTALLEALATSATSLTDDVPLTWTETTPGYESITYVRVHAFTQWAVRNGYILPGGTSSTRDWLINRWHGSTARVRPPAFMGVEANALQVVKLFGIVESIQAEQEEETS